MISGISAAAGGVSAAQARFERAATSITSDFEAPAETETVPAPGVLDTAGAQIEMISAKLAFSASLVALKSSTDMLAEAIRVGGYGVDQAELR
jgi:hypothetical protein